MKFQWRKRSHTDKVEVDLEQQKETLLKLFREEYKLNGYSSCWIIPEHPLINNNKMENLTDLLKGKVIKNVTHNDAGQVTGIEFEVEKISPKRGDFFKIQTTLTTFVVGIFMYYNPNGGFVAYCTMSIGSRINPMFNLSEHGILTLAEFIPVHASEKQQLLDALKADGKCWNAEKKCVEKLRWRAEKGGKYWLSDCEPANGDATFHPILWHDSFSTFDNAQYNVGDYHKTEKDCQVWCDALNNTMLKLKEKL